MSDPIQLEPAILPKSNLISWPPLRRAFLLILLLLVCFGLSPKALATDLDGVLPNGNTADGSDVLISLATGVNNSGFGFQALNHDTTGNGNTATGYQALYNNTTGTTRNTANGVQALYSNTTGNNNAAVGWGALFSNTIGSQNTATGSGALNHNIGSFNTATGYQALFNGTDSARNTANGVQALFNTFGTDNTAAGYRALYSNTGGSSNTANGAQALYSNAGGSFNTASGEFALYHNTMGGSNTATGWQALLSNMTGSNNMASGVSALYHNTGSRNIGLGASAGVNLTTGNDNIDIGNSGGAGESATIRIGTQGTQTATYIAGIFGAVASGSQVGVDSTGHLGVLTASSKRFKDDIKPMDKASESILALKPVTFHYKRDFDAKGTPQFGLVAEEVEKVNPALVTRDAKGEVYTVRYEAVNAMLLNEFLKEHGKVQALEKQVEKLTAGFQKVSAQIEASKPATQIATNNQ